MACSGLWSRIRIVSSITLYWNPSTWTTANCLSERGGYSIPSAGLWTTNLASMGSTTIFYIRSSLLLVLMPKCAFFRFYASSFREAFSSDWPKCSTSIFYGTVEWSFPIIPFCLARQRTGRKSLGEEAVHVEVCLLRTGAGLGASRKRAVSPLIILTIIQKNSNLKRKPL